LTLIFRAAWAGLAVTVLSIMLWFAPPIHPFGLVLAGILPFLAIGVAVAFFAAVVAKQKWLAAASAVALLAASIVVWPFDAVTDCRPLQARSADSLVIYQANVLTGGGIPERYRADIQLVDPDVILLQEATSGFASALDDGSLSQLEHRSGATGTLLWSRFPLEERPEFTRGGIVPVLIDDGFGPIELTSVHTAAPYSSEQIATWEVQFESLAASVVDNGRARIFGGDFNATNAHRPLRTLLDTGLTDVHDVAGCGMDATWPIRTVGPISPPPILRLDHVLISDHFDVVGMRVGPSIDQPLGSDHHPVVVELRRT